MRPPALQPLRGLGQHETADATVHRFQLQAMFIANTHQALGMVDADVQAVLLFVHFLPRQLDFHAQQAVCLVMALGIAELHKTQRPRAGAAVGRQCCQAQQLEMFGGQLGPGQGGDFLGFFGRLDGGGGGGHQGLSSAMPAVSAGMAET